MIRDLRPPASEAVPDIAEPNAAAALRSMQEYCRKFLAQDPFRMHLKKMTELKVGLQLTRPSLVVFHLVEAEVGL